MTTTGVSNKPCAACKHMRRTCTEECLLAPHFPADQPQLLENARNLLGVSKIEKMLAAVHPLDRRHLARAIIYESDERAKNPSLRGRGLPRGIEHTERLISIRQAQRDLGPEIERAVQLVASRGAERELQQEGERTEKLVATRKAERDLQQEIERKVQLISSSIAESGLQNGLFDIVLEDQPAEEMDEQGRE